MTVPVHDERGSVTAFVAVVAIALVLVAGMAYDGGQIIATHAQARSDAAKAARAGAQQIDTGRLRADHETVLAPRAAERAARDYLARAGSSGRVTVQGPTVTVTVSLTCPMHILPLSARRVVVTETATALDGSRP